MKTSRTIWIEPNGFASKPLAKKLLVLCQQKVSERREENPAQCICHSPVYLETE